MLDKRAQILLKALVERYIADGQPVGSRALSKYSGLELSPATVRNVMADLEEMGLIVSPHTSSGRVPTTRGYRFFVDTLLTIRPLGDIERHHLEDHIQPDQPQRVLTQVSQLLSELTRFAGVVMAPRRRGTTFRHVEFLSLSDKRVLLIIVTPDGDVQNRILFPGRAYNQPELVEAANFINQNFAGQTFEQARERLHGELRRLHQDVSQLMNVALEAGSKAMSEKNEQYVISGETNLLQIDDLSSNMQRLRGLFEMFEQRSGLMQLLDMSCRADGVQIFIGGEAGLTPLDECSVVTAPYEVDGQVVGTVGVIGPTRMAYERVIPIVDITAKLLSGALSNQ